MASCDIPVHLGSAALSRCRHDDDDRGPAGSFSSSNTAGSSAKLAARGRHDERSVSESPPGFGIERDDDDDQVAVARRFPTAQDDVSSSAKTSGNITRLTDHANGNFRSHTGCMAGDSGNDSQAVSAMALLLLAASPPSRRRRPAASGQAGDAVSPRGERWARNVPCSGDEFGSVVMSEGTAGQQSFSKHSHEFPGDGVDDGSYRSRYAASPLTSPQVGGGGSGGGGHQYGDDRGEGRRVASTYTRGGDLLRVQSAWRRDEATMTAPVPMRMRSPLRSPSPPRAAGRKKPNGYRTNTWETAGRGQSAFPIGPSRGSGWSKRWVPDSPGAGCKAGGTPASNGKRGRGRDTGSASGYDGRIVARRGDHAESFPDGAGSYQRQQPSRVREHGRSPWPLKIPGIAADQQVDATTEQEVQKREEVEPALATGAAACGGQWRNERDGAKEAAAALGSGEPRPLKRRRAVGTRKVAGSRRPLAMDLNMEGTGEAFDVAAPARNRGVATAASGRPSPRKKSKNLVWSQFRKACDRCTDKKVRCDGSNPTGGFKACTPCKRAGEACIFGICRRSGPRDEHGHKTAAAGVIMKRNDFEKVTERLGQCRTKTCRFVNKDGSFWREHFHCRVGDCSFAGKTCYLSSLCYCVRRSGFRGADFRYTAGDDCSGC
ncbi:conserved unknown protein [Ectocarpus siliculosus]|uniref:Zn(2)-C6 fungal-type domain-containing protein n=1 Tax=Ectocarpus siliculosus TaxID=2880 RepID=D7G066_ECTSI|nr:conserved unknown protein [Ectocarpus siliculosus]|eukprot:CBJ32948.1 conserved unknown protein [Ectocarpus siliculosus]